MMERDINEQFVELQWAKKFCFALMLVCVIGAVLLGPFIFRWMHNSTGSIIITLALYVLAVVFGILRTKAIEKQQQLTAPLREESIRRAMDVSKYSLNDHIPAETVRSTNFYDFWRDCSGNDLVMAAYRGVPAVYSDILLTHEYTDSDHDTHTETDFEGLFFVIDCDVPYNGRLTFRARKKSRFAAKALKTGNAEFDELFSESSGRFLSGKEALESGLRRLAVRLRSAADAPLSIMFKGHAIYIGIDRRKDTLEPNNRISDIGDYIHRIEADVRYITDFLDVLIEGCDLITQYSDGPGDKKNVRKRAAP